MHINVNKKSKIISLDVSFLSSFINKSGKGLNFKKQELDIESDIKENIKLSLLTGETYSGFNIEICGNADVYYKNVPIVELTKKVNKIKNAVPQFHNEICAAGAIYSYLICQKEEVENAVIRIRFSSANGENIFYEYHGNVITFKKITFSLLSRSLPFVKILSDRELFGYEAMHSLPFPYSSMRKGQREFIEDSFRAIKNSTSLLISAPTGTGKTIASIYPAVRALGERKADKIFYLTSKTVISEEALKVSALISNYAPTLRALALSSKETVCPEKNSTLLTPCRFSCPRYIQKKKISFEEKISHLNKITEKKSSSLPYYERFRLALCEILQNDKIYTRENTIHISDKYYVCPYELSLAVSNYCDIVICDYNYVFDPKIRAKHLFDKTDEKYVFLIDEAHNLPARIRSSYSTGFSLAVLQKVRNSLHELCKEKSYLLSLTDRLILEFEKIASECIENGEYTDESIHRGFLKSHYPPKGLVSAIKALSEEMKREMKNSPEIYHEFNDFINSLSLFYDIAKIADEKFTFLAELSGDNLQIKLLCIDPSDVITQCLSSAVSSILFSATLSPIEYYTEILNISREKTLILDSPFDSDKLCLISFDSIDTTAARRDHTISEAAEILECTVRSRPGNYIAYFPSYEYMKKTAAIFHSMNPDIKCIVQKRSMSPALKKEFLLNFKENPEETTVGFAIIGGMFAEGIDLAGERLIGVIVFGTGSPGISSENNIIREYYDNINESGYEFAYTYPGLNNVIQAVGRVIRNENDSGIAVLADSRYKDRTLRHAFPDAWKNIKFTGDIETLGILLDRFWDTH